VSQNIVVIPVKTGIHVCKPRGYQQQTAIRQVIPLGTEDFMPLELFENALAALKTPHPTHGRAAVFALPLLFQKIQSTQNLQFRGV
jgi:hypothetical protein